MLFANLAAFFGCALSVGLGAIGSGVGIGYAATGALRGIARQPGKRPEIFRNMLISQAMSETPAIFAFVISILLLTKGSEKFTDPDNIGLAFSFIGAGLCMGLGALGAGAGCGVIAAEALESMARVPKCTAQVFPWMLISQAWAQTSPAFALVISLLLILLGDRQADELGVSIVYAAKNLGIGICMGAGAIGPAFGISFIGGRLCRAISDSPKNFPLLRNTFIVGAAVSESTAIYSLVIALVLMGINV